MIFPGLEVCEWVNVVFFLGVRWFWLFVWFGLLQVLPLYPLQVHHTTVESFSKVYLSFFPSDKLKVLEARAIICCTRFPTPRTLCKYVTACRMAELGTSQGAG